MPISFPEVIAEMPRQMFEDLRTVLPVEDPSQNYRGEEARWDPNPSECSVPSKYSKLLLDCLEPCVRAILEVETKRLRFIEFTVANGIILPRSAQRSGFTEKWHRDYALTDKVHAFVTADELPTNIRGMDAQPRELIRINRSKHRSPINKSDAPVTRTWVRAGAWY